MCQKQNILANEVTIDHFSLEGKCFIDNDRSGKCVLGAWFASLTLLLKRRETGVFGVLGSRFFSAKGSGKESFEVDPTSYSVPFTLLAVSVIYN